MNSAQERIEEAKKRVVALFSELEVDVGPTLLTDETGVVRLGLKWYDKHVDAPVEAATTPNENEDAK